MIRNVCGAFGEEFVSKRKPKYLQLPQYVKGGSRLHACLFLSLIKANKHWNRGWGLGSVCQIVSRLVLGRGWRRDLPTKWTVGGRGI